MPWEIDNNDVRNETEISKMKYYSNAGKQNIVTIDLKINPTSPPHCFYECVKFKCMIPWLLEDCKKNSYLIFFQEKIYLTRNQQGAKIIDAEEPFEPNCCLALTKL